MHRHVLLFRTGAGQQYDGMRVAIFRGIVLGSLRAQNLDPSGGAWGEGGGITCFFFVFCGPPLVRAMLIFVYLAKERTGPGKGTIPEKGPALIGLQ